MILQVIIAMVAGWINRHQQQVITYLKEENQVLKSKLPGGRVRLTDTERRRLARLGHPLSRQQLRDTATIATPDTLMRWYNQLVASKFDGSKKRHRPGKPGQDVVGLRNFW
jgi:putative transposase